MDLLELPMLLLLGQRCVRANAENLGVSFLLNRS